MNQFPQYDVEMEETHHVHKLDHPSGTAITLAEEIVENIDRKEAWKEDTTDKKYLRVDHIRRGEVPGIHTIRYDSDADLITITHDAHSRKGFALGAVLAAEYTKEHQGLLTISDMFKERIQSKGTVGEVYWRAGALSALPLLGRVVVGTARHTVYL